MYEFVARRELLNQRGYRRPKYPEARSHQHVHGVEFPHLHFAGKSKDRNHYDHECARRVEHHHETPPVFTIDNHACEGEQQDGRERLHDSKCAQRDFRMRGLQNVPGDRSGVHAAADHGHHVRAKDETQRLLLQNGTHDLL